MRLKTLPIFLAFLLMGVADAMGPMSDAVKDKYGLTSFISTLVPSAAFIAFALISVPGGMLAARIGKKAVLLLGLALATAAVAVPAFGEPTYPLLLASIFVLGVGTTFLQVAGNPIMRDVSDPGDYSRNLALAQGIKGVGSCSSTYLVTAVMTMALFKSMGWRGAFPIFFVLMALALVMVLTLKVQETKVAEPPSIGSSLALLGRPMFAMAVLGIFLYVGAEVCMGRFLKPTLRGFGLDLDKATLLGPTLFFACLTFGRLVAGSVKVSPRTFFRLAASLGLAGLIIMMFGSQTLFYVGIVLAGLGFANIWPMLFSITVEEKPECANELSGLMCMAISGGALIPPAMGLLIDSNSLDPKHPGPINPIAYIVPAICFAYLLLLSLRGGSKVAPVVAPAPATVKK